MYENIRLDLARAGICLYKTVHQVNRRMRDRSWEEITTVRQNWGFSCEEDDARGAIDDKWIVENSSKKKQHSLTSICSGLGIGFGIVLWIAISTWIFVYSVVFTRTCVLQGSTHTNFMTRITLRTGDNMNTVHKSSIFQNTVSVKINYEM